MAIKGRQFAHLQELLDYLNGIVLSKELSPRLDLDGLTLIINDGGDHTVTFVGSSLTLNAIVVQINTVVAGAASLKNYGQASPPRSMLAFVLAGLIVKTTGTANALLGLSTTAAKTVGATAVAATDVIQITECLNRFTVIHK